MVIKFFLLVNIFIFIPFVLFSQNLASNAREGEKFDSLIHLYQNVHLEPSEERNEVLNELAGKSFGGRNPLGDRIEYLLEHISLLEQWNSTGNLIKAYNTLGNYYWLNGDPDKSIQSVYKVATLAKSIGDSYWEANAYGNLGNSFKTQRNFIQALEFERRALALYVKQKDTLLLFTMNVGISETFYGLNQLDSAKFRAMKALDFFIKPDDPSYKYVNAYLQGTQARLAAIDLDYESAKALIDESAKILGIYQSSQLDQTTALNNIELGKIFLEHGRVIEAIEFATKGYEIGIQHQLKEVIQDGALVLAQSLEAQNSYAKSLSYYKTYYAYRDSIVNVENVKQIESLRADFEINQKQTELDVVEVRRRNQELISYITAGILLVILILALIVYRSYRQKSALSKELAQINDTKNKLFSIISHDLRGPMAAFSGVGFMIKSAVQSEDKSFLEEVATEVDKSSKQLSSLLDNLLNWSMQQQEGLIVNQERIDAKQMLSELKETFESQSSLKNIAIEIGDIQECEISADRNMTYTIFRNLISNALKFTPENGKITVSYQAENENVAITIKDTGVGMSKEKTDVLFQFDSNKSTYGTVGEKGLGLGLQLVHEFVQTNNGSIRVESEEGNGTSFIVTLPLYQSATSSEI